MKIFVAGLLTETNSFVNLPTSIETFRQGHVRPGQGHTAAPIAGAELMWVSQRRAAAGEFQLVEGSCFRATPAGPTSRQAYEELRDEILSQLSAALPVDAVLLGLHGGMIAFGYPDTEGDLIERVRRLVGDKCVIGVEFDPHCLVTEKRLAHSDVIVLYKEYPHTDIVEQANRLIDIVSGIVQRGWRPVASLYDCRQIDSYPTSAPAMRAFVDRIKSIEAERADEVLSISVVHGFVYGDSPDLSTRILVYTNDAKALGDELATTLGNELVGMRGQTAPPLLSIDAAIDAGLSSSAFPVVIADPTDNAGGGAPSDNTEVLARLIARQLDNVAFGPVWDPVTVQLCLDAGIGATMPLRVGGKVAPTSGTPVDCVAEVIGLKRGAWQLFGNSRVECGDAAAIRIGGVEIALTTGRTQAFSLEAFTQVGIDPLSKQMVFVKSVNHFYAHFGPIAAKVLFVDGTGPLRRDYSAMRYQHVRRPIWPIDAQATPALLV
ncbi:M81 family metallopeptidase [Paraburkholderia sp. MMS20-SJTR3]|uniref:Microcystinase C n=1 Tax=Paraburkholderia sejongensis TaxID=2886946 RepID=A0ABS8K0P5_9BURK|nr:M81 family metallopeptidase [Paraburkholderia sp. MMS20-SJTR3]MCC8395717.1 M81 family metallopeptidase [Paraburkholderia sp. MMS20-SJTR3]